MAATQRVQQKAAIAIGRLAVYHGLCLSLVSGGGLERLVELAVCRAARLDSDYTLVSVVTAVRKIGITLDIRIVEMINGAYFIFRHNLYFLPLFLLLVTKNYWAKRYKRTELILSKLNLSLIRNLEDYFIVNCPICIPVTLEFNARTIDNNLIIPIF